MKRLWMLIICTAFPLGLLAQQQANYNRKGDEAMKRSDYSDAKMWYEEGVAQCDPYSINKLTTIWQQNEKMRPSMRSLMNKCLNCLNVMATEDDSTAVKQLIVYYLEGIGAPKSEEMATYWTDRLEVLRKPVEPIIIHETIPEKPKDPMKFFVGYAFSPTAPYGLTVGGVARYVGWYVRFKTNMSFQNYEKDKNITDIAAGNASYQYLKKKANTLAATAGLVVKCTPWLYTNIGMGYGSHELIYQYRTTDWNNSNNEQLYWCKQKEHSFTGIAAELDFMVKFGPVFVSAGCNTINFKYVDLNAGLGVFF